MRLEDIYRLDETSLADPRDKGNPVKDSKEISSLAGKSNLPAADVKIVPVNVKGKNVKHRTKAEKPAAQLKNPKPTIDKATNKMVLKKKDEKKLVKAVRKDRK